LTAIIKLKHPKRSHADCDDLSYWDSWNCIDSEWAISILVFVGLVNPLATLLKIDECSTNGCHE